MKNLRTPRPSAAHVVILAAGRGSRLGAQGDATPKWLLEVGGRTLADRHLEGIRKAAAVDSVRVVTGHAAEAIERELAGRPEAVATVHVPEYAERNNWWSLLCALRLLPDEGLVVVVNADLCVAPAALAAFLDDAAAGDADGLLAIDFERHLTDESMKVEQDGDGALLRIGKEAVEHGVGEYVGILMARGPALRALRAALEAFADRPECLGEWYEGAVGVTVHGGTAWQLWPMPGSGWVEIDDDADLDQAEALVGSS